MSDSKKPKVTHLPAIDTVGRLDLDKELGVGASYKEYKEDNVGPTPPVSPGKRVDVSKFERNRSEKAKKKKKKSVRQKAVRHFKRFWICYVIATIIFLAVFLPLLFLKIIPAIVQLITDKADLSISGGTIQALSNDEVMVSIQSSLETPGAITVKLDPMDLHMYNSDTQGFYPYATLRLPEQSLRGRNVISVANQKLPVQNQTEMIKWLTRTFYQDKVKISVRGDTTAHIGPLKSPLHLEKTVTIPGLRQLKGMAITSMRIVLPPEADGTNLIGNITIPNYSILTMGLGNSTLNAMAGDLIIGNTTVYNAQLAPGNNSLPIRGQLFLDKIVGNLSYVLGNSLVGSNLQLAVTGNSTIVNGQHIEFLEEVLNNAKLYTNISVMALLGNGVASFMGDNATASMDGIMDMLGKGLNLSSITSGLNLSSITNGLNLSSITNGLNLSSLTGSLNSSALGSLLGGSNPLSGLNTSGAARSLVERQGGGLGGLLSGLNFTSIAGALGPAVLGSLLGGGLGGGLGGLNVTSIIGSGTLSSLLPLLGGLGSLLGPGLGGGSSSAPKPPSGTNRTVTLGGLKGRYG